MQPMLDKDLDKLFQQRFETLETEPSAEVWNKIKDQIDGKKTAKKSFSTLWKVAAGIVIVMSAGLWFYRPQKVIMLQSKPDTMVIAKEPVVQAKPLVKEQLVVEKQTQKENKRVSATPVIAARLKHKNRVKIDHPVKKITTEVSTVAIEKRKSKTPAIEIREIDTPLIDIPVSMSFAAKGNEPLEIIKTEEETPKRKVKSIGSLVNFVISKVDPRKDKIIEFKEGEEGSHVSGINLGLIKLKSK